MAKVEITNENVDMGTHDVVLTHSHGRKVEVWNAVHSELARYVATLDDVWTVRSLLWEYGETEFDRTVRALSEAFDTLWDCRIEEY